MNAEQLAALKKKRQFRKYSYRGIDLDKLLTLSDEELLPLYPSRIRRKFARGMGPKYMRLIKKLRAKVCSIVQAHNHNDRSHCLSLQRKECGPLDKPEIVKTPPSQHGHRARNDR